MLMKLTPEQIKQTTSQIEARPVPEDGDLVQKLNQMFGHHTFFIASTGLHIVDSAESSRAEQPAGRIVRLANWANSEHTTLAPQDPEFTGVIIKLDKAA
jgi:hypothetical protein